MGRVYNALVKADRLTDRQRPIGRPQAPDSATQEQGDRARNTAPRPSLVDAAGKPAFDAADERQGSAFDHDNVTTLSDTDYFIALSEATGARRRVEPVRSAPRESLTVSPRQIVSSPSVRTDAAPATPPVFKEPRQVVALTGGMAASHMAVLGGDDALAIERYRTLAVRLSTLATRRKIKSIVVTSADAGEGKSTVAASLAWTLARRGERRVLLLDANVRASSLKQLLGVAPAQGWLDLSNTPTQLTDAMLRIDPNGLYVMTARGAAENSDADNPAFTSALDEALMSSRFEKLLAELAARFDLIVIDAPALCDSAEAQQIAAIADGCVLVTRMGHTHHRRVSEAVDLVPQEKRLGVVLNECEPAENTSGRNGKRSFLSRLFRP